MEQKDDSIPRKVPQAERTARMEHLKTTLSGINITGDFEPGHCVLGKACSMLEQNVIKYIEPAVCITRSAEVLGATKDKKLAFEHGALHGHEGQRARHEGSYFNGDAALPRFCP